MKTSRLLLPILVAVALALAAGCKKPVDPNAAAMMERPPVPVTAIAARAEDVPQYFEEIGNCTSQEIVHVVPQVSGRIDKVHFNDGADVKRGDVLVTIDPRPFQADLDRAEANLARDQAQLELSELQLKRSEELTAGNYVSKQEIDNLRTSVATTRAIAKQDKAMVESARINLEYCTIKSPIDGRAGVKLIDRGNIVTANNANAPLVVLQKIDPIYVDFTVTEAQLPVVREHLQKGDLKTEAIFPNDPTRRREGQLYFFDNAIQASTGTIKLRALLPNEDRAYWPGQFVKVRLILQTVQGAVIVPYNAVQIGQKGPFVFVIKPNSNEVEARPIKPGQRQGAGGVDVVIDEGLKAGENVVTTGQLMLYPGGKVMVQTGAPAVPPGPAAAPGPEAKAESAAATEKPSPPTAP